MSCSVTICDIVVASLLLANALKNRLPSMLKGNMDWLELYEKSEWYREPKYENCSM